MNIPPRKLLVIGLDGAPFPLIRAWVDAGLLPNIARLVERGSFGVLRSTLPVLSPTAWASFMTGLNPGKHGVFDFVRRAPGTYRPEVVRADHIGGKSLWRLLSDHGRRVGVMNVPVTYPPEPVNGFLLSGLGTPDYVNYAYPPEMRDELDAAGYRVNKAFYYEPGREEAWLDDMQAMSDLRADTALRLLAERPSDFFMVVFRNTDEICHFFWRHMDPTHPDHDPNAPLRHRHAIRDLYQRVDHHVGRLVAAAGDDTNIVLMSDHGMGPLYKDVFLNEWLWQQQWLALRETALTGRRQRLFRHFGLTRANISRTLTNLHLHRVEVGLKRLLGDRIHALPRDERPEFVNAIDWSRTQAYSYGYYGQIFLNVRGREPDGIVEPGAAYHTLRDEIAQRLRQWVDPEDGRPVVDRLYTKEELYDGPYFDHAPDLLAIMRDFAYVTRKGYEFAAERGTLFGPPFARESGNHRLEGILIAAGPDIAAGRSLPEHPIVDLTPTLLHLLHCPVPEAMDGRVIEPLLTETFRAAHPIRYSDDPLTPRAAAAEWTAAQEAEITARLKKLGYLN